MDQVGGKKNIRAQKRGGKEKGSTVKGRNAYLQRAFV